MLADGSVVEDYDDEDMGYDEGGEGDDGPWGHASLMEDTSA